MYNYWRSNRNVILTAVALFVVSLTGLLYFLTAEPGSEHGELKANVVDSLSIKAQQEEENNYRSLLEEYDHEGPLIVLGIDGVVEFASWDFESTTGYISDEVEDELFYSFIHPEDLSLLLGASGKVFATESPVMMIGPYRMRDSNGKYKLQMASLYPIKKDEKVTNIIIAIRNITIDRDEDEEMSSEKSNGKAIRNIEDEEDSRLLVEKLAQLIQ